MSALLLCQGTALALPLRDASVHTVCTSPPYFGLRRYDCGPGELGLEDTPDAYVAAMVQVFREVYRVLRPDGVLFLNMGDSYTGGGGYSPASPSNLDGSKQSTNAGSIPTPRQPAMLPAKNLLGMPWRLAFALQADGWILRSDIIWDKPSCMPESVQDRPTRSHEYVFLFSKQPHYFYDAEAVREPHADFQRGNALMHANYGGYHPNPLLQAQNITRWKHDESQRVYNPNGRNARTVWRIASEATPFAHFATFPQALVRRCLLAGAPTQVCAACAAPSTRVTERTFRPMTDRSPEKLARGSGVKGIDSSRHDATTPRGYTDVATRGWHASCPCNAGVQPATVLDPFCGSGTTLLVARELGHHAIGVDLSWNYLHDIARERLGLAALHAWTHGAAPPPALDYSALPLFSGGAPCP